MRKTLLTVLTACACLATISVFGQGKTCEEAKPWSNMAFITDPASFAEGAWYKYTPTVNSMLPFSLSGIPVSAVQVTQGCNGEKAIVLSEDPATFTISYYLEADKEYVIKIDLSQASGDFVSVNGTPLDLSRAPEGLYCVKPVEVEGLARAVDIKANRPTWFKLNSPLAGQYYVSSSSSDFTATSVKVKHGDCGAVENVSTELMPNYVWAKGGEKLFCVTFPEDASIMFMMQGPTPANCQSHPQYAAAMKLATDYTYVNEVYLTSWKFIPEKTGAYMVSGKGAPGTLIQVSEMIELEPVNGYAQFGCGEVLKMDEIGDDGAGQVAVTLEEGKTYILTCETFDKLAAGMPSVRIDEDVTGIRRVAGASRDIKVAKVGDNEYCVSSYLLAGGAGVYVYDMAGRAVSNVKVQPSEGDAVVKLAGVPSGTYMFLIIGRDKSASTKVVVE